MTPMQSDPLNENAVTGESNPISRGSAQRTFSDSTHLLHGPWHSELERIFHCVLCGVRRHVSCLSLYRNVFLSEVCSLLSHIQYRVDKKLDSQGVFLGTRYQMLPNQRLRLNTRTQTRIRDMQYWLSNHPWATLLTSQYIWRVGIREKNHRRRRLAMPALNRSAIHSHSAANYTPLSR